MNEFITIFENRKELLWSAIVEHIQLSFISLFIFVLIAVPLALFLTNHRKLASLIIQLTAIFLTIPSLALLGLMITLVGIGKVPAVIALFIYALLPILRNTYTGLTDIDPSIVEAADAMGMSRLRKLIKVEIHIAMPVIMAEIINAMVLIIGT